MTIPQLKSMQFLPLRHLKTVICATEVDYLAKLRIRIEENSKLRITFIVFHA